MRTEEELRLALKPFLDLIRAAKSDQNEEFLRNIDEMSRIMVRSNFAGIQENPQLLDKFVDEILEEE